MACSKGNVEVAEEAFAAIPEVAKVEYLKGVTGDETAGGGLGQIQANILNGRVSEAETQLMNARRFDDAIRLQCAMFNFTRAIKVADEKLPAMREHVEEQKEKYQRSVANDIKYDGNREHVA